MIQSASVRNGIFSHAGENNTVQRFANRCSLATCFAQS
jgi:hypothetical protein